MNDHISQEEWTLFFSGELTLPEKLPILRHCAACTECRSLLNAGNNLRFAAERSESGSKTNVFPEEQAFRAVAGKTGPQTGSGTEGYLSFRLEKTDNGYSFANEDPATDGFGNRYAMNRSTDGKEFLDDAGALCVLINSNMIILRFDDPGVSAMAQLILDGREPACIPLANETSLPLPADGFCELEILFKGG